jgi:GNAT superfamily N-acetyltransferase
VPTIRRATAADAAGCAAIVRGLPDYFTENVVEEVPADLIAHTGWVATDGQDLIGFAIVDRRSPHAAEILWMAVAKPHRGNGVGTMLVEHVLRDLAEAGLRVVEAKTLDASAGYEPYVATRAFWERRGFVQIDTIDPLPGWPPGNPAAIYVAALASTRG